ncbi:MAG: hypothetical protein R3B35_12300 [Gemmatimonadales bacterium]
MIDRALLSLLLLLAACGVVDDRAASAQVPASPFAVDSSLFSAVLDAITAREVSGQVMVSPDILPHPDLTDVPVPEGWIVPGPEERAYRIGVIRSFGFIADTFIGMAGCPSAISTLEMREACPQHTSTSIALTAPITIQPAEMERMLTRTRGVAPEVRVQMLVAVRTPHYAGLRLQECYARRAGLGWQVVGKRVLFQTD